MIAFLVDGIVQGLAHLLVVERLFAGVELDHVDAIDRGHFGGDIARGCDRLDLVHRNVDHGIDLPGLELQHAAIVLADHHDSTSLSEGLPFCQ